MGIFDLFKKKTARTELSNQFNNNVIQSTVHSEDKKYYQPDEYYTNIKYEGTPFEKRVITFEERKKISYPSNRGLYVAEILLLEYCLKGIYLGPKNGYPGFWWFEYGIRNVGEVLKTLEDRGYIVLGSVEESVKNFTMPQLKELLELHGQATTGKKADLVERIIQTVPENELISAGIQRKYKLTELGAKELEENAYVPYMHRVHNKTTEDATFGMTFNVWSINKLLGAGDKSNWKAVVEEQENKMNKERLDRNDVFMKDLKKIDPEGYAILKEQDDQLAVIQAADAKYKEDKDLESYIIFWENIWSNGGLKFEGSKWNFMMADLYIKAKRYDDALAFLAKLKKTKPGYKDKADSYIDKINKLKAKNK